MTAPSSPSSPDAAAPAPRARLVGLDVFRGLTMAAMVIVNNPGSWSHVYPPLRHAEWHGCTPTDLIFPFFLFIVGAALAFSKSDARGRDAWLAMLRRAAVLFGLGLMLNASSMLVTRQIDFANLRIMGVLQRIALVYMLLFALTRLVGLRGQIAIAVATLAGYALLLHRVPTPGIGAGVLTPEGNIAGWIDRAVLTPAHVYRGGPMDPEGLVSTLPAMVTALIGWWCGLMLARDVRVGRPPALGRLLALGVAGVAIGYGWHLAGHPLNKPLWTGSYVLYTAGWAMIALAACVWAGQVTSLDRLTRPLVMLGRNAILLFVGSGLSARLLAAIRIDAGDTSTRTLAQWLYQRVCVPIAGPLNGSLLYAMATLAAWWLVLWWCWRRRWFWKV
jgi:predicted acyltransferase